MKNGMLFDRHDSLLLKYVKGIVLNKAFGFILKTKTPEMTGSEVVSCQHSFQRENGR